MRRKHKHKSGQSKSRLQNARWFDMATLSIAAAKAKAQPDVGDEDMPASRAPIRTWERRS